MSIELDHIFILVSAGAPEADQLASFGLTEGAPNTHPGQGTACRRFFFENAYLELLWVGDAAEAQSESVLPTRLWDRWNGRGGGVCPFGFVFRPGDPEAAAPPFATWEYRPPYLPKPLFLQVGGNAGRLHEPLLVHIPFARRPDAHAKRPFAEHPAKFRAITRVEWSGPLSAETSPELGAIFEAGMVGRRPAPDYALEIVFDGGARGGVADFGPSLPLRFRW